jgi:Tol biopolymer transport system component
MSIRMLAAVMPVALAVMAMPGCRQPEPRTLAWGTPAAGAENGRDARLAGASEVTTRRLWEGIFAPYAVSPDGRYVTEPDPSDGALTVLDLTTGEWHRIAARPDGSNFGSGRVSAFSRDGRRVAYLWSFGDSISAAFTEVRVIDFDGSGTGAPRVSEPHVIDDNPLAYRTELWDWSPDGRWVLGNSYGADNSVAIVLYSTTGDTTRTLKTLEWREPLRAAFSPDGRFVAYDVASGVERRVRSIHVVSVDGSRERLVVGDGALNRLFGWDPDGGILYVSQRSGGPALWRLPMDDGAAAGPPELLLEDFWRAAPLGQAGGSFYYVVRTERPALHLAGVDAAAGLLTTNAQPVQDALEGRERAYAWSADGKHLAVVYSDDGHRTMRLAVRTADGAEISEIPLELNGARLHWPAGDNAVLMHGLDGRGRFGFYRVDLRTGVHDVVHRIERETWSFGHFDVSRDGSTLYYARFGHASAARPGLTLVARSLATGNERAIGPVGLPGLLALSPDGSEIAILAESLDPNTHVVALLPEAGGATRELFRLPPSWTAVRLQWTPDGEKVMLVARPMGRPDESVVWFLPVHGGEPRQLDGVVAELRNALLHPDGRRLAFMTGRTRTEIWAMERGARADTPAGRTP